VADDYTTIGWRLDRIEETLRDLGLRVVSVDLYTRDRTEIERRLAEIERDIAEEKLARKEAVREVKAEVAGQGTNWRQAIYAGVIPGLLFLVGILLQLKGGH
jgi:hypothetical protein